MTLLVLASIYIFLTKQRRLQTIFGFIAMSLIPLVIYDFYYFHTVIPQSMVAKSAVYTLQWFIPFLVVLLNSLPTSPLENSLVGLVFIGTIVLSIVITTAIAAFKDWKAYKSFWVALFWLWGVLISMGYILGHAYIFKWYMPLYAVPLLVACYLSFLRGDRPQKIVTISMLLILCVISVVWLTRTVYSSAYSPSAYDQFESGARVMLYLKIGSILNEEYPNAALLTSEIGGLGYSFRGKILDAAGLASPEAIKYHPMKVPEERAGYDLGGIPPGYVKENAPELIVSYDSFAQALLNDNEIISQYNMILIPAYLPEDSNYSRSKMIWGNKFLRIFIRKDLPISERIYDLGK
ncbi:MAG TPA: hypothetical protein VIJ25_01975 [Methylococcales bacterium]